MTPSDGVARWSLACQDVGYPCEWRVRATSLEEITARFYDHARCAHAVAQPRVDLSVKIEALARPT